MGAVTGMVAGIVTLAGAVALYRYAERRTRPLRRNIVDKAGTRRRADTIDFEQDPETGVYRAK